MNPVRLKEKETDRSEFGWKQRMSMSKMNSHLILQTRNACSAQRDGSKDKSRLLFTQRFLTFQDIYEMFAHCSFSQSF